ncbi:transcription factor FAMA [Magnolia sinica]|uniref:transcription factor FAMA n=1 Tax=Magnolia sinica TaxID=86752 RepID=UPI00265AAC92|nr:transcription factor FAMA [Magnolia sinica]
MEKDQENYTTSFAGIESSLDPHHQHQVEDNQVGHNSGMVVDYMLNSPPPPRIPSGFGASSPLDRLSFADVMQFADFGPKLALNQPKIPGDDTVIDPVYFLKFPVLSDRSQDAMAVSSMAGEKNEGFNGLGVESKGVAVVEDEYEGEEDDGRASESNMVQLRLIGGVQKNGATEGKNRRKRPRSLKTSEEVESQRMTHIAVERNRRKQMNEHLRVLRSLMPGSYVQRGDQASIIGGAIEFVRELEQLLQCLESQKRRRIFGGEASPSITIPPSEPPIFPSLTLPNDHINLLDFDSGLREETAENKSCLADVEVKVLGLDAMIKILSRRRPGQLLKTIAALEDLQLNILHTNITTIEQTVLYSFNVKITGESRYTAEDIANSVQQIFSFIHASTI